MDIKYKDEKEASFEDKNVKLLECTMFFFKLFVLRRRKKEEIKSGLYLDTLYYA